MNISRITLKTRAISAVLGLLILLTGPSVMARDVLQQFILASRADDTTFIPQMEELGLNTRTRDDLGNTLLMLAIREGSEKMALSLLQQPDWKSTEFLDAENKLGENALMVAAVKGADPVARALLDLGAQSNRYGWGPLHYAATSGHVTMIHILVEGASYVDAESPNGTTPLMMAARFNHRPAAAALISLGADPTMSNQAGLTARDYAKENNNNDLAFWLELQEISFTTRYLRKLHELDVDQYFRIPNAPVPAAEPGNGVEAGPVIR